ncbi:MAG: acetoacetyl-CoA reductase [Magnetococcales bacterium]|nr:acetoacetyl-CoA reductase [Magnetococcales bacterium]
MTKRVALVTGGMGGIGTDIIRDLAKAGKTVASTYAAFEKDNVPAWTAGLKKEGVDCFLVECDVSNFDSCAKAVSEVEAKLGPVDILVNCAGITKDSSLKKMEVAAWNQVISVNLNSVFNMTKQVFSGMVDRGFGRIIHISSMNGRRGMFGQANYAATKSGMAGFSMSVALEGAKKNVTSNTVCPGYTATAMMKTIPEKVMQGILAQIPAGRMAEPMEIARVVTFLADDNAGFINGTNIDVNGAQYTGY